MNVICGRVACFYWSDTALVVYGNLCRIGPVETPVLSHI